MIKRVFIMPLLRFQSDLWKSEVHRLLLLSFFFGFGMLVLRMAYTGSLHFAFLIWNLFLAFIPWMISYTVFTRPALLQRSWLFRPAFLLWLLFIPNSFYVITDLFHLYDSWAVPRWYDLMLIFCFAWNALLLGVLSVRHMHKIFRFALGFKNDWLFVYPVMFLNALGIFMGRYLRFNSWDIVSDPWSLTRNMLHTLFHPLQYKSGWAMVFCFSFFLSLFYMTLQKLRRIF